MDQPLKKPMNLLEAKWIEYRNSAYPPDKGPISPIQERETKQAFFAACLVVMGIIGECLDKPEEEVAATLRSITFEATGYFAQKFDPIEDSSKN